MKKFLLFMLGTLMALPGIARDFTYEYEGQTLTYTVLDEDAKTCETKGGSIFSGGNYVSGNLIIPATAKDGDMEYSVTSIGMFAFSECSGLTSVTIPESVTSIGDYAFYWCSDLTSVEISNSVSSIGNNAFYQCSNLTSVSIGNSVSSIGVAVFYQCSNLTSMTIPGSVSSIGNSAFEKCSGLKSFKVADGESEISFGAYALASCPIEDLYLGRNWTYAGSGAISTGIKTLTLGDKVTALPANAFSGCSGLTTVVFNAEKCNSVGSQAFPTSIDSFTFGENVQIIPAYCCQGLTKLISVTIPNSVTSIGNSAFENCFGLKSFKVADSESEISFGAYALDSCPIEDLYLGRNWTYAGSGALSTGIKTLTLGDKVTALPDYAFSNCVYLASVEIPNSVTSIGDGAFSSCADLTSVTIPNSVTLIGENAFFGCWGLTSVTIPNSVTSISDNVFYLCSGLTEVIVPPSVETIGASAFAENIKLSSIIMGHNVKTIGDNAFDNCPAQTVCITAQTPPTVSENTFSNYTGTLKVQGEAAAGAYRTADSWSKFANSDLLNEPTRIEIEGGTNINGKPGDTIQLTATLYPSDVTLPQVFWRSTNPAVATVDHNGLVTIHADLSDIMAMAEGDEGETPTQSCKIIAESLYANGPTAEFTINDNVTGVEEINADVIDFSLPVQVYTLQGMMVGDSVENLSAGIYIVRQGKNAKKIAVK